MIDATRRFADNVRARRKALKLTQEAAALSVQMDMSYWSRIERGKVDPGRASRRRSRRRQQR